MAMFKIFVEGNHYEVENAQNDFRCMPQYDIYLDGLKQFTIEPVVLYGHGNEMLWKMADRFNGIKVKHSIIRKLGAAIESTINCISY